MNFRQITIQVFIVSFVELFGIFIGCRQNPDQEYRSQINEAIGYKKKGNYSAVISVLNHAINLRPNSTETYIFRGKSYISLKKYELALLDFSTAVQLNPKNTVALFQKGYTYYLMGKNDSAISFYNLAIKSKGSDSVYIEFNDDLFKDGLVAEDIHMPEIRFYRGLVFYEQHFDSLALVDLNFSLSYDYELSRTNFYIGIIWLSHNFKERGCKFLNKAKDLGNNDAESYLSEYCK